MLGAMVRSVLSFAVHSYFQERKVYVNTPIITGSDAEGAGEMFKVTALPFDNTRTGKVNYKEDFLEKKTNLTVSGQLKERLCNGFGSDFGPTFRAENLTLHVTLLSFFVIEPELLSMT
jgi:asparaginyl-tRNA synthetase